MKSSQQKLMETINYLDEEQCELLDRVIRKFSTGVYPNELIKMAGIEGNFDYALPQPLVDRCYQINENFDTRFHIYDYRKKSHGEFTNIAEQFVLNLQKQLSK